MTDVTLRIKNLSISLETLSRINNEGSPDLYDAIETALRKELEELTKEQYPIKPVRSARTSDDDDIPF